MNLGVHLAACCAQHLPLSGFCTASRRDWGCKGCLTSLLKPSGCRSVSLPLALMVVLCSLETLTFIRNVLAVACFVISAELTDSQALLLRFS